MEWTYYFTRYSINKKPKAIHRRSENKSEVFDKETREWVESPFFDFRIVMGEVDERDIINDSEIEYYIDQVSIK